MSGHLGWCAVGSRYGQLGRKIRRPSLGNFDVGRDKACQSRSRVPTERSRHQPRRRNKIGIPAKVERIEYDPNRSANIALLCYADGERRYILAPHGLAAGQSVVAAPDADIQPGNALPMQSIPLGTTLHNIELRPGKGGQLVRSAGTGAQLIAREGRYALLRLPSGEMRKALVQCYATVGQVGNLEHENETIGKAGRNRWKGWRPTVRGVAMNPVDHPHGGGEGRTSGGRHPVSPWGQPTKGRKTRNNPRTDQYIVRRRKKK